MVVVVCAAVSPCWDWVWHLALFCSLFALSPLLFRLALSCLRGWGSVVLVYCSVVVCVMNGGGSHPSLVFSVTVLLV